MPDKPDGTSSPSHAAKFQLSRGLAKCVQESVQRSTPFMSDDAARTLTEDVTENVMAFLQAVFELT